MAQMMCNIREASDRSVFWLRTTVFPLWLEKGVDWNAGAFHEHLDPETLSCDAEFRRLRVAARQIYTFAQAAALGVPHADDAVELGLRFLERHARLKDGGYARCFDLRGNRVDSTLSLYDQAFALLALASTGRRAQALALINFIDTQFRHSRGGYVESLPPKLPRQQNTHMHLFEACLAAAERFSDGIFLEIADRILDLFVTRFLQSNKGILAEFFDQELKPLKERGRYLVEPGHLCEWVWLIAHYSAIGAGRRRSDEGLSEISGALMNFTDRYGMHPERRTLYDAVWDDGSVHSASSRLWPQTERLKAEAVRPGATARQVSDAYATLAIHVDGAGPGLWREHLAADGSWAREPAPASSLYHLTGAILLTDEAIRTRCW